MLLMLRDLNLVRMRRKMKMLAMLALKLRHSNLRRLEVMHLFLLLSPALPRPTSPLLLLHLPVAQPPPLPLRLCDKNTLSFIRSPVCRVQL
jgi:hypothetical protein